jgi:RNA polymerase sigma factor (sigma-70 family)
MATDRSEPDVRLWALAQGGDPAAFGALFARHRDRVYNYCFRRTGSWSNAEDALSLVFMETWRRRHDVEVIEDSLLPWLFAVANNVARNVERSRRRYANLLESLPEVGTTQDHADDVASRVDDEKQMRAVLVQLKKLGRLDQDVIAMCDWEGLTYDEASAALGVPIGTVKSRLSRARQRLRVLVVAIPQLTGDDAGGNA